MRAVHPARPKPPRLQFLLRRVVVPKLGLHRRLVLPTAERSGYNCRRADDVKAPGIILNDIYRDIAKATVVIAEITAANPNVYYEVGVAHALGKKTILLAQEGTKPPFDISPYRIIFYPDRIRGSLQLQEELARHLAAVMNRANGMESHPPMNDGAT